MSSNELYIRQMNDRGGLTIPPEIRKHLGLTGSEHVSFKVTKNGFVEIAKVEIREVTPKKRNLKKRVKLIFLEKFGFTAVCTF